MLYIFHEILNYLLTPCSRVLSEKLTCFQLVKNFPALYGTQRFISRHTKKTFPNSVHPSVRKVMQQFSILYDTTQGII